MLKLGRGRTAILWLAVAVLLFAANGSAWRDLVSSPAGTIVHVSVKGSELVSWLKGLALLSIVVAIVSLFANRLVIWLLSVLVEVFAIAALISTLGKWGVGKAQVGVSAHFFWLPATAGLLGILGAIALGFVTSLSARTWTVARYRAGEKKAGATSFDMWRAQDAGADPTANDETELGHG